MPDKFHNIVDYYDRLLKEGVLFGAARGIFGDDVLVINKFGANPDIDTTEETVWDFGGLYPWQTSAEVALMASTDADDTFGGAGAQSIKVQGLDGDYNLINEIVELDGLTPVPTVNSYLRIFRMSIPPLEDGSGGTIPGQGVAQGTISATQSGTVRAQIVNGNNQTLMSIYTIPAGYTGFLVHGAAGVGKGKDAIVKFYTRPFNGVFNLSYIAQLFENNVQRPFLLPPRINEKSDIDVRAISTSVNIDTTATFDIILIRNPV